MLSASAVAALSVVYTVLYVLPFYLSSTTRPSPTLSRDAPSVIRARIRFVTASVFICSAFTIYLTSTRAEASYSEILHLLGWHPFSPFDIAKVLSLTALLFAGPLFDKGIIESGWRRWAKGRDLHESLSSWIGWRNYIAGPFTEEMLFRSLLLSLHLLTRPPSSQSILIFVTPLYFGIAHIHHFYEYSLTHPFTPLPPALLRSIVQLGYTTVFGWYAAFLFLRTGNLWGVVVVHAFCNWMGLPRVWGRVGGVVIEGGVVGGPVRGKEDKSRRNEGAQKLGLAWTAAYYITLIAGAMAWWKFLWVLSESERELVKIG
ncbi:MAG: hypothetical protein ASARMPRED_008754 [Alectoria sarmentosa]|nr:MAG: hypothetical protein ASARMPRED_008754 [Alectoria sarmentosa]